MGKETIRYSEGFKLQVVSELESGEWRSPNEARLRYGIRGKGTLERWVRQYGKNHLLKKVVRVERPEERDELKKLNKRVRELEAALADAHLDLRLEEAYVELACEAAKIKDIEGFKKKHGGKRSTKR